MFETSVVHTRVVGGSRYRLLTLSLAVHSCAIAAVVTATLISVKLPENSPRQMEMPPLFRAVTIPPALGTPKGGGPKPAPAQPQPKRAEAAPPAVTAPDTIADRVTLDPQVASTDPTAQQGEASDEPGDGTGKKGDPTGIDGALGDKPATSSPTAPVRVYGDVKAPVVISRVLPEYPRVAVVGKINGWVIVECIIDKTGHIREAKVLKSSFAAFDQPAIDAVQKWVFTPGSLHGEPVDTIFDLTVQFTVR